MDKIKQWTVLVSAVSIISGILLSVIPQGKLRPAYKTLIGVVLIYAFMSPLINSRNIDFNISEYLQDNYQVSENYDKYAVRSAVSSAERAVERALDELAASQDIFCNFSAECELEGNEVVMKKIQVSGVYSPEIRERILGLLSSSGFNEDIISFKGEADEQ